MEDWKALKEVGGRRVARSRREIVARKETCREGQWSKAALQTEATARARQMRTGKGR